MPKPGWFDIIWFLFTGVLNAVGGFLLETVYRKHSVQDGVLFGIELATLNLTILAVILYARRKWKL